MERLTKRAKRVSGLPGVCCTRFESDNCVAVAGHCSDGCPWEEAAWDRLAAYEDTGLEPEEIIGLCSMHERSKMAELLRLEKNRPLTPEVFGKWKHRK